MNCLWGLLFFYGCFQFSFCPHFLIFKMRRTNVNIRCIGTRIESPKIKLEAARKSTYYQWSIIFNELPTNTRKETDFRTIKKHLFHFIFWYLFRVSIQLSCFTNCPVIKKILYKFTIIIKIKSKTKYDYLTIKARDLGQDLSYFSDECKWLSDLAILISLFRSFQNLAAL